MTIFFCYCPDPNGAVGFKLVVSIARQAKVKHYAQMVDDDLLDAHKTAPPVDHLARLRKA